MIFLKIILCILLSLIAIFAIISLSNAVFEIKYTDKFCIYLRVLFVKIDLLKLTLKKDNKKKVKKQSLSQSLNPKPQNLQKTTHAEKKAAKPEAEKPKKGVYEQLSFYKELALSVLNPFSKHLRMQMCRIKIILGSPEPSQTACEYGAVLALMNGIYAYSKENSNLTLDEKSISVTCDFLADKPVFDILVKFKIRIFRLIICAFSGLMTYLGKDD